MTKIAEPLSPQAARDRVSILGRWPVHSPDADDVVAAARISQDHQLSFWDAMILTSASSLGCDILWTEDLNAGQIIEGVRVINPFDGPDDS